MNFQEFLNNNYYLHSSLSFFKSYSKKRIKFINNKRFLFNEISNFLNNCIDNSKNVFVFCAGNSILCKNLNSRKVFVKEIDKKYEINYNENIHYINNETQNVLAECDTIIISDIEHQLNPALNLINLKKLIKTNTKIIVLSKNIVWMILLKFIKSFFNFSPKKNNFLPYSYLDNLFSMCDLEIVRNEKIITLPIYIPIFTNLINRIFRLPLLNIFCL